MFENYTRDDFRAVKFNGEMDTAGYNVWRAEGFKKVNTSIIPAEGSQVMGDYSTAKFPLITVESGCRLRFL